MRNFGLVLGLILVFCGMLTGTIVFADTEETVEKKSYYVEAEVTNDSIEKDLELVNSLEKKVTTKNTKLNYRLDIEEGNVILTNLDSNKTKKIYSKGNAKYITEVNFYYYDATYLLIITEDGSLYSNIYSSVEDEIKFRKIKTNNKVTSMKVVETTQRFYEHPKVELFGLNETGDWELIRL